MQIRAVSDAAVPEAAVPGDRPAAPSRVGGMDMTLITRATGGVLVLVGLVAYVGSGAASLTALIPAVLGLVVLGLGVAAGRERLHRHMIHAALVVALLGLLASLPRAVGAGEVLGGGDVERPLAALASLAVVIVCVVYLALGIRSFVAARRAT